ncbi:MAG: hypothetical protein M1814_000424 [Vezdaea aestivalis]|nr:MAG: hypothetical protein M1814_000424 [Vezdaea aestivalis]
MTESQSDSHNPSEPEKASSPSFPPNRLSQSVYNVDPPSSSLSTYNVSHHTEIKATPGLKNVHFKVTPAKFPPKRTLKEHIEYLIYKFSTYYKLLYLIVIINIVLLVLVLTINNTNLRLSNTPSNAFAVNLVVTILIRQEHMVNTIFRVAGSFPQWLPLRSRCLLADAFHYGGIHVGCAFASLLWLVLIVIRTIMGLVQTEKVLHRGNLALLILLTLVAVLFILIMALAHPKFRSRYHDDFELVHRIGGWTALGLFWAIVVLFADFNKDKEVHKAIGWVLIKNPTFWILAIATLMIIYPWTMIRPVPIHCEGLSNHAALIHFSHKDVGFCAGVRVSKAPMRDWHAFATVPHRDGRGFFILVSNAGDWTNSLIQSPPQRLWIRAIPTFGVLHVAKLFKRIVLVATGSGIGPCLSMLVGRSDIPTRILWSTRDPVATYGEDIVQLVISRDADARIIDTARGRPDMVEITHQLYQDFNAEAVFVISNPRVTAKIVDGMNLRGVPAFGPIFDS